MDARGIGIALALALVPAAAQAAASKSQPTPQPVPKSKWVPVGDKLVAPKTPFAACDMVSVRNLRFFDGILEETGAQCTILCGELVNMTDREDFFVRVEFDMWRGSTEIAKIGTASYTVNRPGKKAPIPFRLLLPASYNADWWKNGCKGWVVPRITVEGAKQE